MTSSSPPTTRLTLNHEDPTTAPFAQDNQTMSEAFPSLTDPSTPASPRQSSAAQTPTNRSRESSNTSSLQGRLRSASKSFQESNPPTGMWVATGQLASSMPTFSDIRRGTFDSEGWSGEGQVIEKERRASVSKRGSAQTSEVVPRRRALADAINSMDSQSGQGFRHQSVAEVDESEQYELQVITSGIPTNGLAKKNANKERSIIQPVTASSTDRSSRDTNFSPNTTATKPHPQYRTTPFDNGYQFPPKHSWGEATKIFLVAFWKFCITPIGFLVTIYGLNVIAWGGMLFLLLCDASPAMCKPTCNDINSPRRKWIEIDSQILNALFCVTGFGTIPWRFRDLYYLLQYRVKKNEIGLRRLAGINRGWFRLAGSQDLPITLGPGDIEAEIFKIPENCVPFPINKISNAPLTGIRAPPTAIWKLDFVIWTMVWNTFLQAVLSGLMWGLNRHTRPSWSTGLFIALACIVAACGGIMSFVEGKKVKSIEGIPVSEKDQERLRKDKELGITHWNNIKGEQPKEPKEKKSRNEKGPFKHKQKHSEDVHVDETSIKEDAELDLR